MEVHSSESSSKLGATVTGGAAATAGSVAGDVTKQKENESSNGSGGLTTFSTPYSNGEDLKAQAPKSSTSRPDVVQFQDRKLLLEDSTADTMPIYCTEIFTSIDPKRISQADVLMMMIYCVALESGYAASDAAKTAELESVYWGSTYHARNINKLAQSPVYFRDDNDNYVLKLVFYKLADLIEFRLCGIVCGDLFVVTLSPDNSSPGFSVCLSIPRYVLGSMKSPMIAARFQNLKELAYLLKDRLFVPAKIDLHEFHRIDHCLGLCGIPEEIILVIAKKLRMKDVQNLSRTCKTMRYFCMNYWELYCH